MDKLQNTVMNKNINLSYLNHPVQTANNPFEKESFATYRDWEEHLIEFMAEQAKNPNLASWQKLNTSAKTLEIAACCATVLANLIDNDFPKQSRSLFQIAEQLKAMTTPEFDKWLRSGWLNIADVNDSLHAVFHIQ